MCILFWYRKHQYFRIPLCGFLWTNGRALYSLHFRCKHRCFSSIVLNMAFRFRAKTAVHIADELALHPAGHAGAIVELDLRAIQGEYSKEVR